MSMYTDNNPEEVGLSDGRPSVYSWPFDPKMKDASRRYAGPPRDRLLLALQRHHGQARDDTVDELVGGY